jgi:hypothetical protein
MWCGEYFVARDDQVFCSPRCCAAFARGNGEWRERFHEAKVREHPHVCEQCGYHFRVSDYAQRGGQRAPRFCSTRCRVAWHREHKGETRQTQQEAPRGQFWTGYRSRHDAAMAILGLTVAPDTSALKRAWKAAIKKVHPDVCKDDDAVWKAQRVNWAYDFLKLSL